MKKIFSLMLVLAAMFAFTACDNTDDMSDEELTAAIIKHSESGFVGKIVNAADDYKEFEGKHMSANFDADGTFAIYFGEKKKDVKPKNVSAEDAFWTGKWKVLDGKLLVTDDDDEEEEWYNTLVISKEGKRLTYSNAETFTVELD